MIAQGPFLRFLLGVLRIFLLLATASFTAPFCKGQAHPFPNHERWILPNNADNRPLNGQPKKVTEYYLSIGDTSNNDQWRWLYFGYRFNADGDLIYLGDFTRDTATKTSEFTHDDNGVQTVFTDRRGSPSRIVSKRRDDFSYTSVWRLSDGKGMAWIDSFPPGGAEQIVTRYEDTVTTGIPVLQRTIFYDGDKVNKAIDISRGGGSAEWRYFRSRYFIPDSIQLWRDTGTGPVHFRTEIYVNNDHGDPVRYIVLQGQDTVSESLYAYSYDKNGNWVKQIETVVKAPPYASGRPRQFVIFRKYRYRR